MSHRQIFMTSVATLVGTVALAQSPPRVQDRPVRSQPLTAEIAPREESLVQIVGEWVGDPAQCEGGNPVGGRDLFVTDTLIRWGDETCSARNVQKTGSGAIVSAVCVSPDGRQQREIEIKQLGPAELAVQVPDEPLVELILCQRR
jgi:hypothetical protein